MPSRLGGILSIAIALLLLSRTNVAASVPAHMQGIAFQKVDDTGSSIYTIEPDNPNPRRLTNSQGHDIQPAWSPEGQFIAFASDQDYEGDALKTTTEIYLLDVESGNLRQLTSNAANDLYPAWSPDGRFLAFSSDQDGDFDLYVMNSDGSNQCSLTNTDTSELNASWSPDGTRIIFSSSEHGAFDIHLMDVDGRNQRQLVHIDGMNCGSPDWSPDGKSILFSCYFQDSLYSSIYVVNTDSSNLRQLTDGLNSDADPVWSSDGTQFAFTSNRDGQYDIYLSNIDELETRRLTHTGGDKPSWQRPLRETTEDVS